MVRTRADCSGIRVGSKASFKTTAKTTSSPSTSGKRRHGAGNRYHPRATPSWQKEITHFLNKDGDENAPNVEEPLAEALAEPAIEKQEDNNVED